MTVIERAGTSKDKHVMWHCLCDCGKETRCNGGNLRQGKIISCGCWRNEIAGGRTRTHGMTNTRLYKTWRNMITRCYYSKCDKYHLYGGRGIHVCEEWKTSFEAFYDWAMNSGYGENLTIDRIDTNQGYYPENCRWITQKEQCNNKRTNHLITYNGETHTMKEWSRILGIPYGVIRDRIKWRWTIEDVFTKPIQNQKKRKL